MVVTSGINLVLKFTRPRKLLTSDAFFGSHAWVNTSTLSSVGPMPCCHSTKPINVSFGK